MTMKLLLMSDDRSSTSKTCITCCYDGWLWPWICMRMKSLHLVQTFCHPPTRGFTFHQFGTGSLFYLSSHNHSIRILSLIYLSTAWSVYSAIKLFHKDNKDLLPELTRRQHFVFIYYFFETGE
jgi:hypothetical protein